jgi:succinate dehydrogenase/fumarate reductase-like Fe-S protein
MQLTLKVWRQDNPNDPGRFETYQATDVKDEMSFLEMLDAVNENLIEAGREPIVFDSDCREGICGTCGLMINGQAHGPQKGTTTCQLHMRKFRDGETVTMGPGDVMVQRGTNHAWINRYDEVCRMVFVLIDAKPLGFTEHLRSRDNEHRQLNEGHKG